MEKEFVIVVAVAILLSFLAVLPVISGLGDGNVTGVSKTNENCSQMAIGETLRSGLGIGTTAPVMSVAEDENATDVSKTNSATKAESIFDITKGEIISGVSIANKTNVSELELPVDIAATGDLVGKIAFTSDRDGDFEIYVMDADGTNVVQLTSNYYPDLVPDWSPDCKKIAFTSNSDGYGEIYVMDADGSNVVPYVFG